jgi:hypothetical protein
MVVSAFTASFVLLLELVSSPQADNPTAAKHAIAVAIANNFVFIFSPHYFIFLSF